MDLFAINLIKGRITQAYGRMVEACERLNFDDAYSALLAMDQQLDLLAKRLRSDAA